MFIVIFFFSHRHVSSFLASHLGDRYSVGLMAWIGYSANQNKSSWSSGKTPLLRQTFLNLGNALFTIKLLVGKYKILIKTNIRLNMMLMYLWIKNITSWWNNKNYSKWKIHVCIFLQQPILHEDVAFCTRRCCWL